MITVIDFSLAIFSWVGEASLLELPERPIVGLGEAVIFARITSPLITSRCECLFVGQSLWPATFVLFNCYEVGTDEVWFVLTAELKWSLTDLFYYLQKKDCSHVEQTFLWTTYFQIYCNYVCLDQLKPLLVSIWCQLRYGSWTEMPHSANIVYVCSNSSYFTKIISTALIQIFYLFENTRCQ